MHERPHSRGNFEQLPFPSISVGVARWGAGPGFGALETKSLTVKNLRFHWLETARCRQWPMVFPGMGTRLEALLIGDMTACIAVLR
jgi:hypothetical protein